MNKLLAITSQRITANKDSVNAYLGNSYASLQSVMDALDKPLKDAGIGYAYNLIKGDDAITSLTLTAYDTSNAEPLSTLTIPLAPAKPQELGAQLTYFRRYALCVLFNVIGDEDTDAETGDKGRPKPLLPKRTPTPLVKKETFTI